MNQQDADGLTGLICASGGGHLEVVRLLCKRRALLDLLMTSGFTALMEASGKGHYDVVSFLVEKGATLDLQVKDGWTAPLI